MKKLATLRSVFFAAFAVFVLSPSVSGQILAWQFGNPASAGDEITYAATTVNADLNPSNLSRGSGLNPASLVRAYSSNNFTVGGTKANAISANKYVQFTVSAVTGYRVSLTTLDVRLRRTSTGPDAYIWRYSTDGSTFTDIGSDISFTSTADGVTQAQINLSGIGALQNVPAGTTITLRLYAWGASATTGTFAIGRYGVGNTTNSLALGGNVEAIPGSPVITCAPMSLDLGGVVPGNESSDEFEVTASNLSPASGNLTVTAPGGTDFLVSDDNSTWVSSFNIPYTGGSLTATPVYVQFSPAGLGAQGGDVAVSGGGASTTNVAVSGTGIDPQIYWNFNTATPTYDFIADVSTSALSQGNNNGTTELLTTTAASSGYTGASGGNNAGAAAFTGAMNPSTSTYFQFTLNPTTGYGIAINTIRFGSRSTSTGPQAYSIRWSLDGYTSDLVVGTLVNTGTWALEESTGLNLVSPTGVNVSYRIYGHSGSGSASAGTANWRIDDLELRGAAIQPAAIYYSQSSGNVNDPIWSDTPTGSAGPAIFTSNSSMVVQDGHTVTVNVSTNVDDLTLENGASLTVNTERLLSIYGDQVDLAGTVTGTTGEFELIGFDATTLTLTGTIQMWNLTVANAAGVEVLGNLDIRGTLLLADGDFDATNATVRLRSTADGNTGRLGPVGAGADYIGELTMQRRIPAGVTNWRLLGSAVEGRTVNDWNDDFITAGFPGSNYPNFDDPVGSGNLWPSVRWYDETVASAQVIDGLVGVSSINQALVPGQGFAVWCGDALGGTSPFVIDVTGEPVIAKTPLTLPMSWTDSGNPTSDGWNLVSNPLPSPVSYSDLSLGSDVGTGYYIYDPVSGSSAFWDPTLQESVPAGALNGVIQSSQAFWLRTVGSNVTTTVVEAAKVEGNDGGLFGGASGTAHPMVRLTMQGGGDWYDQAAIVFEDGTPALDGMDALKLDFAHPSAPRIATRTSDGHDLILNRFGGFASDVSIPVTVRVPVTGTYTISAAIAGMEFLSCFSLEDLLTGTVTPLTDGASYSFSMDATTEIVGDRFVLHASTPMPFTVTDALCAGSATGLVMVEVPEGPLDITLADAFGNAVQTANGVQAGTHTFDGVAGGNYIIQVDGNTACGQITADITILEPFVMEATVEGLEASCPNTSDGVLDVEVLGGEAPYTFNWSNGSTEAAIMDLPGTYDLLVTDANGCILALEGMEILAGDGPIAGFEMDATTVLTGEEVFFTNTTSMADAYYWDFGDGNVSEEDAPVHIFTLPGIYTVTLYAYGSDCEDSWSVDVTVQVSTRISEAAAVVTNVWSDGIHFVVDHGFEGKLIVEVLDATGRLHMQRQVAAAPGRLMLPASTLNTGIWFVRLTHGQDQKTYRVPLLR
jgi:PKD repeat protein